MAIKYRLNRYNWLGQKLLAQHQYGDIIRLRHSIVNECPSVVKSSNSDEGCLRRWPLSEHLIYVSCLALMKTSSRLDEVIFSLQRLNSEKNHQYFLLLCQCLLCLGRCDSVVALCKQLINKEIDSIDPDHENSQPDESLIDFSLLPINADALKSAKNWIDREWTLAEVAQETVEFKKVLADIRKNKLINEPRLWLTFGTCLEYQHQYKSANFAFQMAAKLTTSSYTDTNPTWLERAGELTGQSPVTLSYYHEASTSYAERCIHDKADYLGLIQSLSQISSQLPPSYAIDPLLALVLSAQPARNRSNFDKAIEIISSLEIHSTSSRNPSSDYNRLALRCTRKVQNFNQLQMSLSRDNIRDFDNKSRFYLNYLLAKSYISLNSIVQNSDRLNSQLFTCDLDGLLESQAQVSKINHDTIKELNDNVDKLMFTLRNSDSSYWSSAALWNNLGLCYLIKRRFIACLSCFLKALQLNPLDWRLNYNLALVCLHVGLRSRAIVCLLQARTLYSEQSSKMAQKRRSQHGNDTNRTCSLISSLLAICYDHLHETDESRRLHIEATRPLDTGSSSNSGGPVLSLLNYLIFLDRMRAQNDDLECSKVILHLLDKLEQRWLQRDQNDPQFNVRLLNVAQRIGERAAPVGQSTRGFKMYAWTKHTKLVFQEQLRD